MNIRIGLDIGSTTAKGVALDADDRIIGHVLNPTGTAPKDTAKRICDELSSLGQPSAILSTGYSRHLVDWADRSITEITCHARGVHALHPDTATIIDIGGQDSKAIRLDTTGGVADFAMNDRCASGTGSFLDAIARRFDLNLEAIDAHCPPDTEPLPISSTCVVFAESEIVGLLARGEPIERVLAGVHAAIASRVRILVEQVRGTDPIYFSGGVAQNDAMRRALENELGRPVTTANHPQLAGAIGAALLA